MRRCPVGLSQWSRVACFSSSSGETLEPCNGGFARRYGHRNWAVLEGGRTCAAYCASTTRMLCTDICFWIRGGPWYKRSGDMMTSLRVEWRVVHTACSLSHAPQSHTPRWSTRLSPHLNRPQGGSGRSVWPRVDPAVIMLTTAGLDEEWCLLGRKPEW